MVLSDQYQDSFSDDSQDDSYSDYSAKAKTPKKRAPTTNKKTNKSKNTGTPKRPGRKPMEKSMDEELGDDPKLKRKAQNRAAQRAFRERKEKHVSELEDRIRELEEEKSTQETDLKLENAKLKQELEKLREENYSLKDSKFTFEYPLHDSNSHGFPSTANSNNKNTFTVSNAQPLDSPPLSSTTPSISGDYNSGSNSDHMQESSPSSSSANKSIDILNNFKGSSNTTRDVSSSSSSGSENNSPTSNNSNYGDHMASFTNTVSLSNNNNDNNNNNSNNNNNFDGLFNINDQKSTVASFGLFNDLGPNFIDNFAPSNNPDTSDLFHGKTDFAFSSYRNPVASADDWLFQDNAQLPALFGVDTNQYGLAQQTATPTGNSLPLTNIGLTSQIPSFYNVMQNANNNDSNSIPNYSQNSIGNINSIYNNINNNIYTNSMNNNINTTTHTPTYDAAYSSQQQQSQQQQRQRTSYYNDPELTPSKAMVLETIRMAKEQGKTRLEVKAVVKSTCPDFDVDILCDELRRKAICYDSAQPFSDNDLDIVTSCVKQH